MNCTRNSKGQFVKGKPTWNKGTKGIMKPNSGSFKKGQMKGEENVNWKGGITQSKSIYIHILIPNHPFTDHQGYVREHRLVAEKILGRYLTKKEVIHHINGIKDDNRSENLYLFPNSGRHISYHLLSKNKKIKPILVSNLINHLLYKSNKC